MFAAREAAVVSQFNTINFSKADLEEIDKVERKRKGVAEQVENVRETVKEFKESLQGVQRDLEEQGMNVNLLKELQAKYDDLVSTRLQEEGVKTSLKDKKIKETRENLDLVLKYQSKIFAGFVASVVIALVLLGVAVYLIVRATS